MTLKMENFDQFCGSKSKFWDLNVTWYTNKPDFSRCFEQTVLIWIPCGFLWLAAGFEILYAVKSKTNRRIPNTVLNLVQRAVIVILIVLQILHLSYSFREYHHYQGPEQPGGYKISIVDWTAPVIKAFTFCLAIVLTTINQRKGIHRSGVLFTFWLLASLCGVFEFQSELRNLPLDEDSEREKLWFIILMNAYPLTIFELVLSFFSDKVSIPSIKRTKIKANVEHSEEEVEIGKNAKLTVKNPCPEEKCSFPSALTYHWFGKIALLGYRRPLEYQDLWDLNPQDKSKPLIQHYFKFWKPALMKCQKLNSAHKEYVNQSKKLFISASEHFSNYYNNNTESNIIRSSAVETAVKSLSNKNIASIFPALVKANWSIFLVGSVLKLVQDLLGFVSPQILELIIQHVSSGEESWKGYLYAVLLFITSMAQTMFLGQYFQRMFLVGMRIRSALVGTLYQKSLVISNAARKQFTLGEVVNLMSVDCQRFVDLTTYVNMLWSAPLQITLSVYFLWKVFGSASLAGLSLLVLLIPLTTGLANYMKKLQIEQMENKDQRIKRMNEILSGIKVLKLYAWEPSFEGQIRQIRVKELAVLRKIKIINCLNTLVGTLVPFLISLCTFATYVLMDDSNILDAKKAFVGLTLFNIMRMPMAILPMIMVYLVEAGVSLKRINRFMNADEIDEEAVTHTKPSDDTAISVQHGSFSWGDSVVLRSINLEIKRGSLVAIVGSVGSGKSSLVSAILGEMEKQTGTVNTFGSVAYVAQQAWIQNATLQDNILFGKDYDPVLYKKIVDVSALRPDLQILPAGDQTEIGEKGINLSGGQKQRVALARAAYHDADIYLLDDPLYAVDSHVGKHLFESMIGPQGILKSKTRVMVTHGITNLPHMDNIIVLNNGRISETGSFSQLLEKKGAFADFLVQHAAAEDLEHADKSTVEKMEAIIGDQSDAFTQAKQLSGTPESENDGSRNIRRFDRRASFLWSASSKSSSKEVEAEEEHLILRPNRVGVKMIRRESLLSTKGIPRPDKDKLIEDEKTEVGSVKRDVYSYYLKSVGWCIAIVTFIFHVLFSGIAVYTNVWLAKWTTDSAARGTQNTEKRDMYLSVYGALGCGQAVTVFFANIVMALGSVKAARYLHDEMLTHIMRSPMSFFETTPLGRIVNRFSKDIDVADNTFPENLRSWVACLFNVLSTIAVISYSTPWFLVIVAPIGVVYYGVQRFYVASSRQMKRLESVSRSPLYSHFSETLTGSMTIRAFSKQAQFIRQSEDHVDYNHIAYYPSVIANRWLAVRLETVGNLIIFFAAVFAVSSHSEEGSVGLSVSYALGVTQTLNWLVRMTSDVETNIVGVESIKEYAETPQEAEWEIPEKKPSPAWPQTGNIKFIGYQSRYRKGLDLVLKDVSCDIQSGEKIGIVGRTGAGKSSLTLGLFRIVEAAGGSIKIDGIDLSSLGLHDVRGNLTIIPQDPILFSGSLRFNLDPFLRYSDVEIWHALEYAHLKHFVSSLAMGLEYEISEGGENLSVGQRQLVCLARALLRKTKVLILDEATAAVDLETDDLIQETIRSEFKVCTVLTIAHRLNTIMDCNRVMVLDDGRIREFDNPQNLLKDQTTIFYGMAKDAGVVYSNPSRRETLSSPEKGPYITPYTNDIILGSSVVL